MLAGWEGEGGGGGEYDRECPFDDDRDDNKYNDDNEYNNAEDGNGSRGGVDDGVESNYNGHDVVSEPSFGGVGQRTLIVRPHAAAAIINDNDVDQK
jgi:hypothetical protein